MKRIIIINILYSICQVAIGQCTIKNVLPFETGKTKFQNQLIANSLEIYRDENMYRLYPNSKFEKWLKPSYLLKDSIYQVSQFLTWNKMYCSTQKKGTYLLQFADDTLYRIVLTIDYSKLQYQNLQTDYTNLLTELKKKYIYELFSVTDKTKNEQSGEGYYFYPERGFKNKKEQYSVSIEGTRDENKYVLRIEYINTKHSKFSKGEYW